MGFGGKPFDLGCALLAEMFFNLLAATDFREMHRSRPVTFFTFHDLYFILWVGLARVKHISNVDDGHFKADKPRNSPASPRLRRIPTAFLPEAPILTRHEPRRFQPRDSTY